MHVYRVIDPYRLLHPPVEPLIRPLPARKIPFFRPTQGITTGPGSGGGSIRALRRPNIGPVPGPIEINPIVLPPRPI
jgi:hypothetical protein